MSEPKQSSAVALFRLQNLSGPGNRNNPDIRKAEGSTATDFSRKLSNASQQSRVQKPEKSKPDEPVQRQKVEARAHETAAEIKPLKSDKLHSEGPGKNAADNTRQAVKSASDSDSESVVQPDKLPVKDMTVRIANSAAGELEIEESFDTTGTTILAPSAPAQTGIKGNNVEQAELVLDEETDTVQILTLTDTGSEESGRPAPDEALPSEGVAAVEEQIVVPSNSEADTEAALAPHASEMNKPALPDATLKETPVDEVLTPVALATRIRHIEARTNAESQAVNAEETAQTDAAVERSLFLQRTSLNAAPRVDSPAKPDGLPSKQTRESAASIVSAEHVTSDKLNKHLADFNSTTSDDNNDQLKQSLMQAEYKRQINQYDANKPVVKGEEFMLQKPVMTQAASLPNLQLLSDTSQMAVNQLADNMFPGSAGGIVTAPLQPRLTAENGLIMNAPVNVALMTEESSDAMASNIRWMSTQGIKNAVINVTPSGMGPISVQIGIENEQMNVSIIATQGTTREALDSMLPRLREQLASQGHESVRVDVSDGRSEHSKAGYGQQFNEDGAYAFSNTDSADNELESKLSNDEIMEDSERLTISQLPGAVGLGRHTSLGYDIYV